jgi:hypothetical protein|tara:strand:+ start:12405 stop:12857 length:453 start_codon:yes stop_codon:yes gene_type:complete
MENYQVGQILFFIADSSKVIPIQVIEEVVRTTLEGKEKTYIAKLPDKKETTVDIKKLKGHLFTSKEDAKKFMMHNANEAINHMINQAVEIASGLFNDSPPAEEVTFEEVDNEILEKVQPDEEDDIIKVDLGNGTFGKVSVSNLNQAGVAK